MPQATARTTMTQTNNMMGLDWMPTFGLIPVPNCQPSPDFAYWMVQQAMGEIY